MTTKQKKDKKKAFLYSVFHLNLAYSSIAEKEIPDIIKRCYWPLLCLAEKFPQAVSLEASGYTLEMIQKIDPAWIRKLRELLKNGVCEFIGSGYSQIIGTLVPAKINEKNLAFGNEVYHNLLGTTPIIAYINEQAYGAGLLAHYKKAGYQAIIMEWNNPAHFHPEWESEMSYYPQIVEDQQGVTLPIVWNNSTHFQRFQRYVHDEIDAQQFFSYIASHSSSGRYICLYGSDAETFDFRPGRFHTEATLNKTGEWIKIQSLFKKLSKDKLFRFILPSKVLLCKPNAHAFKKIHLESAVEPLPVKKQEKYNIGRWGLTGKKTVDRNTDCYKIYTFLKQKPNTPQKLWKELCFLWSSDFRTHIEPKRESLFISRLSKRITSLSKSHIQEKNEIIKKSPPFTYKCINVKEDKTHIIIKSKKIHLVLNCKRGMIIENLTFNEVSQTPLITTLSQGYYEDNDYNVDFFSGHATIDIPGLKKITDLSSVKPIYKTFSSKNESEVVIIGVMPFGNGTVKKTISIISGYPKIKIKYTFSSKIPPRCSFGAGFLTFNPKAFNVNTLFYACHNGGYNKDIFSFGKDSLNVSPVSLLVSSRRALGNTTGILKIGDKEKTITITTKMQNYATLPILQFKKMLRSSTFFLRSKFSLQEFDDTTVRDKTISKKPIRFELTVTASKKLI